MDGGGPQRSGITLFPQVIKTEVEDLLMEIKVKVIVVYESKYGNTKRVAETIVESMKEIGTIDISISELKEINVNTIPNYDAILIGSPNHMGGPTRGIRGFI
ncbi:MAG: flavodoxin domain-containing protein, partial [Candidatus Bathyarchaeia archaeon]